jgi:hypothetical protein
MGWIEKETLHIAEAFFHSHVGRERGSGIRHMENRHQDVAGFCCSIIMQIPLVQTIVSPG